MERKYELIDLGENIKEDRGKKGNGVIRIKEVIESMKERIENNRVEIEKERKDLLKDLAYYVKENLVDIEEISYYLNNDELIYLEELMRYRIEFPRLKFNELIKELGVKEVKEEVKTRRIEKIMTVIGEVYIPSLIGIIGLNGHGKTLLSLEILEELRKRGENTLYIQMEDYKTKNKTIYQGSIVYMMNTSIEEIERKVKESLATAVVIDSLAMIKRNNIEEEREIIKRLYLMSLRRIVIVINHLSKESKRNKNKIESMNLSDSIGSSYFENLIDLGVIIFKENERYFRYKISKNRWGQIREGSLRLEIEDEILRIR